ncbi:MAG: putative type effector protein [Gemmataceae bacterium]|nr:putative type effector protein [Gemmataceae bacterium]
MKASLELANDAKLYTRAMKVAASNKKRQGTTKTGEDRKHRRKQADQERTLILSAVGQVQGGVEAKIKELARLSAEKKAGNCAEQAAISYFYLVDKGVEPVWLLALKQPGDHVFVGLGEIAELGDVDKWGPDTFICDPWANIACRSGEYRAAWAAKMQKWSDDGKTLDTPRLGFIDPLGKQWFQAINKHAIIKYLRYPANS